ncbi:MAG: glycosyltransferase [Anaerolineae bacterium]|nr:glycosyltransferase [Anaerolineae bacterium]
MKVALVHDWLNQMGGAENVLETLVAMFPQAAVYTSMYGPDLMPAAYRSWDIRTSFMQRLPGVTRYHQAYMPLYPLAFRSFRLRDYDLVLSNKSAFCHGVQTGPNTTHICYCLTPTRFLWMYDSYRQRESIGGLTDTALRPLLPLLRRWDYAAAQRVDHFIAISSAVQERIRNFYHRESVIIHPPVDTARYTPSGEPPQDYFLVVGRLIPYKRIDLAVRAFTQLGLPLVVVGDGRDRAKLEAMAGRNVTFRGWLPYSEELLTLYRRCRAFIFPGLEDFGIAPVEAQATGRPVIAYAAGGALDTVQEGVTGTFFYEQTPEALAAAVRAFDPAAYDPAACRASAERFSVEVFKHKLLAFIAENL